MAAEEEESGSGTVSLLWFNILVALLLHSLWVSRSGVAGTADRLRPLFLPEGGRRQGQVAAQGRRAGELVARQQCRRTSPG